jgi:hypothetical protein
MAMIYSGKERDQSGQSQHGDTESFIDIGREQLRHSYHNLHTRWDRYCPHSGLVAALTRMIDGSLESRYKSMTVLGLPNPRRSSFAKRLGRQ